MIAKNIHYTAALLFTMSSTLLFTSYFEGMYDGLIISPGTKPSATAVATYCDITDIDPTTIIIGLFKGAKQIEIPPLSHHSGLALEIQLIVEGRTPIHVLHNRNMPCNPFENPMRTDHYNKHNGAGRAEKVIAVLKKRLKKNAAAAAQP